MGDSVGNTKWLERIEFLNDKKDDGAWPSRETT